ncbi:MAG TPA: dihydrofolate reductase family protein, partial [Calditrichia bacterium]|nr:dihydrofolate reductase family protein [Calditrichia bacterium]
EVSKNPGNPEVEAGKKFTDTPKVVFTRTLTDCQWDNTVLARGGLAEEINRLKGQDGADIIAYGGGEFVSGLIREGLIDDYFLMINPAAIGRGMPVFEDLKAMQMMKLVKATPFACGIVGLHFRPERN